MDVWMNVDVFGWMLVCLDGCLGVGMDVWTDVIIRVKFSKIRGTKILEANFVKLEAKLLHSHYYFNKILL
jgi:hypothetical protein